MVRLLRRLQYFRRRRQLDADLAEEIEAHRTMRQRDLEARGFTAEEAAQASRRTLGNVTLSREDARAVWMWSWIESVAQDIRYARRSLIRQPGFSAVAILTMAAAIGLNTSVFTVFSAFAFRPWAVPEPDLVVRVQNGYGAGTFSLPAVRHLSASSKTLDGLFAMRAAGNNVIGDDSARVLWVSGDYFRILRAPFAMGRPFAADDDRPNAPIVAVISHGYWQRRFGGDPAVIRRPTSIEDIPVSILGVADRDFTGTTIDRIDVWMPLSAAPTFRPNERWVRDEFRAGPTPAIRGTLAVGGRLAPGATAGQAQAELTLLAAQLQQPADRGHGITLRDTTALGGPKGDTPAMFLNMFAAVMLVLLLACANVGNLLLARAAARRREIAVRLSLGASRRRLVRQLLTESVVLAGAAAFAGIAIAAYLPPIVVDLLSDRPTALRLAPDTAVLGYTVALSVLAAVLFGLAPALHATRATVSHALKESRTVPTLRFSLRSLLLTAQVALSVVLLIAAALLLRGVSHARAIDLGFDVDGVSVVAFQAPPSSYDAQRTRVFAARLEQALGAGGEPIALTQAPPLGSGNIKGSFRVDGRADEENNTVYDVTPRYFDILGIPLLAGRLLTAADRHAVVVNESLAKRLWTIETAVGKRIVCATNNGWNIPGELEIVGVVRDARTTSLQETQPTIYQPFSGRSIPLVLTPAGDPAAIARTTAAAQQIDPRIRASVTPLSDTIDSRLRGTRVAASVASAIGLLALLLATVGMFGVFTFWVQQRTHEIGIRMALGARRMHVISRVLGSTGYTIAAGLVVGCGAAAAVSRLLRGWLFGLNPLDPLAYAAVMLLLAAAAVLATVVPARRAANVDPVVALRHE